MGNSASMPDLAAAGFLSQSRGPRDPSRMSALLAAGALASSNLSAGLVHSEPVYRRLVTMHQPASVLSSGGSPQTGVRCRVRLELTYLASADVTGTGCALASSTACLRGSLWHGRRVQQPADGAGVHQLGGGR